jgi:hypothetical protein
MTWVLEPENELLIHAIDENGSDSTSRYWIANTEVNPAGGAAAAIANGVQGISSAFIFSVEILRHATWDAEVTPTEGPYQRPADQVLMQFSGQDGSPVNMALPGPNEIILNSDAVTINPAQTDVAAFVTYVINHFKTQEGYSITGLTRGFRRRPPRRKKQ